MALRVTQQSVDVLSEATGGKLRVTQFYVEVLGTQGASEEISDTISFSDSATDTVVPGGILEDVSSALALSDVATAVKITNQAIVDTLTFVDTLNTEKPVDASSALALTDQVNQVFEVSAANALTFSDIGYQNLKFGSALDTLTLSDEAISSIKSEDLVDSLGLTDSANSTNHLFASNDLGLTDTASQRIKEVSASSALAFTDAATVQVIHTLSDTVDLADVVSRQVTFNRQTADTLALEQTVSIFIDRQGVLCIYTPFVGDGPLTIDPTPPIISPTNLQLFWPVVSPSITVDLRNADFGNRIAYNANRIYRRTRGGTKLIYRKSTWPKFVQLTLDISVLNPTQISQFRDFLNQTLGLEVGVRNHDGLMWKGIITTPDTEITQTGGRGDCLEYATSFQFEGELIT